MKVSLNIVKQLTGLKLPDIDVLVERINQRLGGVEEVIDLRQKYKDAKIVRVVECEKHPNADKLSVCKIDTGKNELVQVVCGAPNVHADMFAVWLPPESVVPSTFEDTELFVLGTREIRGVMSHGMLAAADELAIGSDHSGIIEIKETDFFKHTELITGSSFAETFGLDDVIIDIENKMFTHRPDLFGQLGVAREINAILQESAAQIETVDNRFENPDWYWLHPEFSDAEGLSLEVFNEAPEASPKFMAVAIKDVKVTQSPLWLKCQLVVMGSKPINNVVDWTNYIMIMTAQPTHAYDYDKLHGQKIGVRMAKQSEKIKLLNEKVYELTEEDVVIADSNGAIGLAGVMGGFDSEVSAETKNIVLEVANFDMYKVRKTSMRYGLFTDAVTRFNKGQSPLQADRITKKLLELLPGEQASPVYDLPNHDSQFNNDSVHGEVIYNVDFVNKRLGTDFSADQIGNILRPANIATYLSDKDSGTLTSTAPFWRTDIELPEDVVEEVGRLYGFDNLKRQLPSRSSKPAARNETRQIKQEIRKSLSKSGANEALTYSFVHENVLKKAEQDPLQAFRLSNALSPDLHYYRLTVLPSLLDKVHPNIKSGNDEFMLFEIGKGHNKKYHLDDDEGLPKELNFVDAVYASKKPRQGTAYYSIRRILDQLADDLGLKLNYKAIDEPMDFPVTNPFDLSRSALVETKSGVFLGIIGELKQSVQKSFKLPEYSAAMSLDLKGLIDASRERTSRYAPLSRYPSTFYDVSIKVPKDVTYQSTENVVKDVVSNYIEGVAVQIVPLFIYQVDKNAEYKTFTFRLKFTSDQKTLTDKEVSLVIAKIDLNSREKISGQIS